MLEVRDASSGLAVNSAGGHPLRFALPEVAIEREALDHVRAFATVAEIGGPRAYAVYLLLGGLDISPHSPVVAEVRVRLASSGSKVEAVEAGRVFTLPERGKLDGTAILSDAKGHRLYVNVPGPSTDPDAMTVYVFDLGASGTTITPIDIRLPPR